MDIAAWLRGLELEQYEQAFRDHAIDLEVLPSLTAQDLKDMGVLPVGHRRKLLDAIAALRPAPAADALPVALASAGPDPLGEQRQVTVLFADLVGYTALSNELDAEEVHALLGRFFERVDRIVEEHGGRIDKHIGDCVMAVFGAPVAHGNDAERAVRAALAIRDALPELAQAIGRALAVHIGVASGQVVAGGTGSAEHREYTVTGESVNLAARLTDEAAAGEVLISEAVRRPLADRLECGAVGTLEVKGFDEPVRAWRLLDLRPAARVGRRPLVGRQSELHHFRAALAACRQEGQGQTIYLRGEAGIGKTRLVEEFQRIAAEEQGFACHSGLVLDFGAGLGRDAVRSIVRSLVSLAPGAGQEAAGQAATQALACGLLAADRAVYLNDLLDLPQPKELRTLYDAMDNSIRSRGKQETVAELVAHLSRQRPLLLVVEDLHWADRITLEYLAALAETVAARPALLVMTSRSEGDPIDHGWRSSIGGAPLVTIDLGPLRREDALALANTFDPAGRVAAACVERAAGNPLYLEHLLRHAEGSAGVAQGVPGSVQNLVQARVDRLDPADKRALQAASIFGQRFSLAGLRHLLGDPAYGCGGLERQALVRPLGEDFLFAHALVREAVYASLLRSRRRELHRLAAGWFERRDPVLRAEHLDRAERPEAARAYLDAAQTQAEQFHYERARGLVERGLEIAADGATKCELMCLRGDLLRDLGAIPDSIAAFDDALRLADGDAQRCRAWIGLAAAMRIIDRYEDALRVLDLAQAAAAGQGLAKELARIHYFRGNIFFPLGNIDGCLEQHGLALRFAREASSPEDEARALSGLADAAYIRGRVITARGYYDQCIRLCREHGFGRIEVANLHIRGQMRFFQLDTAGAVEDRLAGVEAAAKVRDPRAEAIARSGLAHVFFELGRSDEARDHAERGLALARHLGARRFEAHALMAVARVAAVDGRRPEAVERAREAVAISREAAPKFAGPWCLGVLASVAQDPEERRRALSEGEELLRSGCASHNYLWFYRDAMQAALELGAWGEAERYAAALEDYTRPEPLPWSDFYIVRGRALAAWGRGRRDQGLVAQLARLQGQALRAGLRTALPEVEAALAASVSG